MSKARVLVVDDDGDILDLLKYNLEKGGFKVKTVIDSREALDEAKQFEPDLIILDIMMPYITGIELCRQLRELNRFKDTYIFFLTAKSESYVQDTALKVGGNDFIQKVIGLRSLTHKVAAVLKKHFIIRKDQNEIKVGHLKVNRANSTAIIHGEKIPLAKPELDLLFFLAQNPRKVITTENMVNNIWGSEIFAGSASPETYLDKLSEKLGAGWIQLLSEGKYKFIPH